MPRRLNLHMEELERDRAFEIRDTELVGGFWGVKTLAGDSRWDLAPTSKQD